MFTASIVLCASGHNLGIAEPKKIGSFLQKSDMRKLHHGGGHQRSNLCPSIVSQNRNESTVGQQNKTLRVDAMFFLVENNLGSDDWFELTPGWWAFRTAHRSVLTTSEQRPTN